MTTIRRAERVEVVTYSRSFALRDRPGAGFGFPCDEAGTVDIAALPDEARLSYAMCLTCPTDIVDEGVRRYVNRYTLPAVLRCGCGREVTLDAFTSECPCGRDYNMSGQLLAPREQWGEDTGESLGDMLRGDGEWDR